MKHRSTRPLLQVYGWTLAAILVPCWVGSAFLAGQSPATKDLFFFLALLLFGLGSTGGVSVGVALTGRWAYAWIGFVGRLAVFGVALTLEWSLRTKQPGHPYITAMGAMLVCFWAFIDFVTLGWNRKQGAERP